MSDDLWKDSVCAACGQEKCMGTCPDYAEFERQFLLEQLMAEANEWAKHQDTKIKDEEITDALNDIMETVCDRK